MNELKCLIVDDEPLALDLLEDYIKRTPFLELVARCSSGPEVLDVLRKEKVDVAFMDIQMPYLNGLELSRMTGDCAVIFTTAFEQYALEGFRVNALDYLLKPFSYAEFLKAANKAMQWKELHVAASSQASTGENQIRNLVVKSEYKQQIIRLADITYIEGSGDYITIHTENGIPLQTLMSLKTIEEQLPKSQFARVHRSFIVNIQKIRTIERQRIVFGKVHIPISDSFKDEFFRIMGIS